jgi:hypothetical protein
VTNNQKPFAYAGSDKIIITDIGTGVESVSLDASGSVDANGSIVSYIWESYGTQIGVGEQPTINLPAGVHLITLIVTDDEGAVDTDDITITIYDQNTYNNGALWLELECETIGSNWDIISNQTVSGSKYVVSKPGFMSLQAPTSDDDLIKMSFNIGATDGPTDEYTVYGRMNCPSNGEDSFWVKMDNGPFNINNGLKTNGWEWKPLGTFDLSQGTHTIDIGYRENGAQLDKLLVTKFTDTPLGIGNDASNSCSSNLPPVANAGTDQTAASGEPVILNGLGSSDSDGTISSYSWTEVVNDNQVLVATGANPSVNFTTGTHVLTLTVTDNNGGSAIDTVSITINAVTEFWLDAECGTVGSLWQTSLSASAVKGKYVKIQNGLNSTNAPTTDASGHITYQFNVEESGNYDVWARVRTDGANHDSFWMKMDNGSWFKWNNIGPHTTWGWEEFRGFNLGIGLHTLTVAYREDRTHMDKLYIGTNIPSGGGVTSNNCSTANKSGTKKIGANDIENETVEVKLFPNPAKEKITIDMGRELKTNLGLTVYDITGREILRKEITSGIYNLDVQFLETGTYFIQLQSNEISVTKTFIKVN